MKIKDLPKVDRPREKLAIKGSQALKKEELLGILLRTGIKGKNVLALAKDILRVYGGKKLLDVSYRELKNIHGVGPAKATHILAAIELGKRLYKEKTEKEIFIHSSEDTVKELSHIRENKKENFIALYLDARNRLIYKETVSVGTLNSSIVHPREVFEPAIRHFAAQIILAHNHPSGDPEPSEDDLVITRRLIEAGKIMGVEITDHVIVGKNSFISFKEKRLL
ncbi:MAG: DNA repair protein RadC [Candidatus Magasanikbacteria bacterium]|nr:DNA repair protein RadC [Candidatus Magasanikbacteria bacterium]